MAVGLVDSTNRSVKVVSVQLGAEVTDDFGVFTVKHKFVNDTSEVIDANYLFPISNSEIIVDFKIFIGNEVVMSHLVEKREQDNFEGYSLNDASTDKSSFKVHIGKMAPGRTIETELKYIKSVDQKDGYCKVVIPTVVMPNFTLNNNQYSFDGFGAEPNYDLKLDFTYYGKGIKSAQCKTHDLWFDTHENKVRASIKYNTSSNYDIIIDIKKDAPETPVVYKYNNIVYLSVYPDINIYDRQSKKFLFMVNATDKHKEEIKNAIHICLKALGPDDMFNIIMLSRQNSVFADGFKHADDETVREAIHWFDSYELGDSVELFSSVISSYKNNSNTIAMIFTDIKMSQNKDIMRYIENHKNNTYYTFEMDSTDDKSFLKALSDHSGGKYYNIPQGKRADLEIINAFNIIAAPFVSNVNISFDDAVSGIASWGAKKIHYGDKVGIIAEVYDRMPTKVYIDGIFSGKNISLCTRLDNIAEGGSSLRFLYAKSLIDNLASAEENLSIREQQLIHKQIVDISEKYSIYNKYMDMLLMNYNGKFYDCVSIIRPKALPFDWYLNALNAYSSKSYLGDIDTEFIKIIKKQKSVGCFIPAYSRAKENVAKFTGEVVSKICTEYNNPALFMWQLRKSILFMMNYISNNDSGEIPEEILQAFDDWHKILGGNDEISQKVQAICFMYRKNS